jgi:hypothetical protein
MPAIAIETTDYVYNFSVSLSVLFEAAAKQLVTVPASGNAGRQIDPWSPPHGSSLLQGVRHEGYAEWWSLAQQIADS